MRIAEIFRSIQGEGRLTGTESLFVRTSGCNLRCRWCDTPYASWMPEGDDLSIEEILARLDALERSAPQPRVAEVLHRLSGAMAAAPASLVVGPASGFVEHVVVTGGEPMLSAELIPLCEELRGQGRHITIETAGTLHLPVACDLMSISPKLSNSTPAPESDPRWSWRHEAHRHAPEVLRRLMRDYDYQLKFVVANEPDCAEVEAYLALLAQVDRRRVMLMPQGTDPDDLAEIAEWLAPYCAARGYAFCPRKQIEWFGTRRGV